MSVLRELGELQAGDVLTHAWIIGVVESVRRSPIPGRVAVHFVGGMTLIGPDDELLRVEPTNQEVGR